MRFRAEDHPIHRANLILARAVGGSLPPALLRMDLVAKSISTANSISTPVPTSLTQPTASMVPTSSAKPTTSGPSAGSSHDDVPQGQPRTAFHVSSAEFREFDPFLFANLGELMVRIRHVLGIIRRHVDCDHELRKSISDLWKLSRSEVDQARLYARQNSELIREAWAAGRLYLGPKTKAGKVRMKKEKTHAMTIETAAIGHDDDGDDEKEDLDAQNDLRGFRRSSSPSPESHHQVQQQHEDGDHNVSDMGYVSSEVKDEDDDSHKQEQDQLHTFDHQEEQRRLGDQLPQVSDQLRRAYWMRSYALLQQQEQDPDHHDKYQQQLYLLYQHTLQQHQQQQQQPLAPSDRARLKSRWGGLD